MSEQRFEKGQLVLIRHNDGNSIWNIHQYFGKNNGLIYILGGYLFEENNEIIPYEGNEHFLGTTDSTNPKWKPTPGELVAVSDDKEHWYFNVFLREADGIFSAKYCAQSTVYNLWKYCEPLRKHFNVPEVE